MEVIRRVGRLRPFAIPAENTCRSGMSSAGLTAVSSRRFFHSQRFGSTATLLANLRVTYSVLVKSLVEVLPRVCKHFEHARIPLGVRACRQLFRVSLSRLDKGQ